MKLWVLGKDSITLVIVYCEILVIKCRWILNIQYDKKVCKSRGTQISIYEPEKLRNLYQILQEVDYFHLISEFYYILILYLYFSWYVLACNSYFRKISCYHKLYICKKEHKDIFGDFWIGLELWLWWWHHGYIQKSKLINMY